MANPSISVVIPVKNGAPWLKDTLPALFSQSLASGMEVIAIDSGSTDDTLSILSGFPVKVIHIAPNEFNHGRTRNLGVQMAAGQFVVMTVQDARPADEHWLQELLKGFDGPDVAGVCGQQIVPHDTDKNPVAWFRPQSAAGVRKYQFMNVADYEALGPDAKQAVCRWDDVTAMYRKDVLLKIPFREVSFAEDALWAQDAVRAGYGIVYNSRAKVFHYHHENPSFVFRRSFTVFYHFHKFFGVKPAYRANGLRQFVSNALLLLKEKTVSWNSKFYWLFRNLRLRTAYNRAVREFLVSLDRGEVFLENKHAEYCGKPPVALHAQAGHASAAPVT